MNFEVSLSKPRYLSTWKGEIDGHEVTACSLDVNSLFHGLEEASHATFEISNVRPRYKDHHIFRWHIGNYVVREVRGDKNALVSNTSQWIRDYFENRGEGWYEIFISVY